MTIIDQITNLVRTMFDRAEEGDAVVRKARGSDLRMFTLDVLRYDVAEQVPSILRLLNDSACIGWRVFWPQDFTEEEVLPCLEELIGLRWIKLLQENEAGNELVDTPHDSANRKLDLGRDWFSLTPEGRAAWESWDPPEEAVLLEREAEEPR